MIIKFWLVFPKIFLLHKVVRDAKKVEKHCSNAMSSLRDDALLDTTLIQVDFFLPMLNLITSGSTQRLARQFNPQPKVLPAQTSAQRKRD